MEYDIIKRHAYLIIAHTDQYCLNQLIKLLDDSRNDIYLLIDSKSLLNIQFTTQYSQLYVLERYDIRWGDISQVKAELKLLKAATSNQRYSYYHLISGQDLPIKTQNYIHNFFNNLKNGTNLIGFCQNPRNVELARERFSYRVPLTRYLRSNGVYIGLLIVKFIKATIKIQKLFGIRRRLKHLELKKGANWFSITDEFARYVVLQSDWIIRKFKHTISADELVMQTLAWNTPPINILIISVFIIRYTV